MKIIWMFNIKRLVLYPKRKPLTNIIIGMVERSTYPNRIRVILAEKLLTNRWLAEKLGVNEITVSRWVTNKVQPSMAQFIEISKLLKVELTDLLEKYDANIE